MPTPVLTQFLRESLIYGTGIVATRAISLLLVPLYTRAFGPAEFGAIDFLAMLANFANLLLTLEISQGVARFLPSSKDPREQRSYVAAGLWFSVLTYSGALIIALFAAMPMTLWVFESAAYSRALVVALLAMWANGVFYFLQNLLRWQLQAIEFAKASVICSATTAAAAVGLIVGLDLGVEAVFWGQLIGALVGVVYALRASRIKPPARLHRDKLVEMLAFSTPLMVSSLAVVAAAYSDRVLIKEAMSLADLGVYALAQKIAATVSLLLAGFQYAITPLITHRLGDPTVVQQIDRLLLYFLTAAFPVLLALAVFSRELLLVFATPDYSAAQSVIPFLGAASLVAGMYVFTPGLWVARKGRTTMIINLATAAINIGLNVVLVPKIGIAGATVAALTSAAVGFCAYAQAGQRYLRMHIPWLRIASGAGLLALLSWLGGTIGEGAPLDFAGRVLLYVFGALALVAVMAGPNVRRALNARFRDTSRQ